MSNLPNFPIDVKIAGCAIAVAKMVNRFLGQGATDQRLYDAAKANVVNGLIDIKFFQVLNGGSISPSSTPEQAKQGKFMQIFMLLFISIASLNLPTAIALYWTITNFVTAVQNVVVNKKEAKK